MAMLKAVFFTVGVLSSFLIQTQGADKYTDGNRPYEFGFSIDGEQHRHEKKDEKGLIMGEFGFITADGVYHVTVYATDEQGRFKILSMKNIRVKPYPTYKQPAGSRQGHSLDLSTPKPNISPDSSKPITIEKPGRSCSSCSLPTTTTIAPLPDVPNVQNIRTALNADNVHHNEAPASEFPHGPQENVHANRQQKSFNETPQQNLGSFPASVNQPTNKNKPQTYNNLPNDFPGLNGPRKPLDQELVAPKEDSPIYTDINGPQQSPNLPGFSQSSSQPASSYPNQQDVPGYSTQNAESPQNNLRPQQNSYAVSQNTPPREQPKLPGTSRTAKNYDGEPEQPIGFLGVQQNGIPNSNVGAPRLNKGDKPTLFTVQMKIVDKNTDINKRGPGEKEGLPTGLTKDDMSQLLYTFNYTVGFHGHFEEGYRNGAKQGYYYVTGRNGVRTRVDYVADEQGFRPKITQEVLDLLSDDVPKPDTEKEEKYGLKGYEFKWLYYPVESKRQ